MKPVIHLMNTFRRGAQLTKPSDAYHFDTLADFSQTAGEDVFEGQGGKRGYA